MKFRVALVSLFLALFFSVAAFGGVKDPIEGDAFHALIAAQDADLRLALQAIGLEDLGCLVTGPLDPFYDGDDDTAERMRRARVVCPSLDAVAEVLGRIDETEAFSKVKSKAYVEDAHTKGIDGFRGVEVELRFHGDKRKILLLTVQQTRWLIWVRDVWANAVVDAGDDTFGGYAAAVSDYLYGVDLALSGEGAAPVAPRAVDHGLPDAADLYAPAPDYVIDGYQNFKDYLFAHEEVRTPFAHAITAFVPGDSLREAMVANAREAAWPNKEEPLIQHEYQKFFDRGGDVGVIRTLTASQLQTLVPGEYFYCVGLSGDIRFGYEIPREEVEQVEAKTGSKMARANHSFLFPGEPVLTAGAFFVEAQGEVKRIARVNAQSGHYFYSNVTATIREDIAVRSDEYLMTLGHFLATLERLGIDTEAILISKM